MPARAAVFQALRNAPAPSADEALVDALPGADLPTMQAIVHTLLARRERVGLRGLVEHLHALDEASQQLVLERTEEVFGVLREAFQTRVEQTRLNVLLLIRQGCAYRAAYLVEAALHDRSARVRESAAETLYGLADKLLSTSPITTADEDLAVLDPEERHRLMMELASFAEDRRQVVGAVASGLSSFGVHLHPQVVEAAMWLVDDLGARFWSIFSARGSRPARAASGILIASQSTRLIPFTLGAVNYGEFRVHAVRLLTSCHVPDVLSEWTQQAWRFLQPKAAKAMGMLRQLACTKNRGADLKQLSAAARRCVPRWLAATSLAPEAKVELLRELYRTDDREVRRAAVWALTGYTCPASTRVLRTIASSRDTEAAVIARHELARRHPQEYPPGKILAQLEGGSPSVQGRGGLGRLPDRLDGYWSSFDRLSPEDRVRAGQGLFDDPRSAIAFLRRRLAERDPTARTRAVRIIKTLKLAHEFTETLYQLSRDTDVDVRGAAIAALGQLGDPTSKRILQRALVDEDARVQANAVEALGQSATEDDVAGLLPKLTSGDNRVRANAVRALLKLGVRESAATLLRMLQEPDRNHRISALWLVGQMGLVPVAARIAQMAVADGDEQVRQRAAALKTRLSQPPPEPAQASGREEVASSVQ